MSINELQDEVIAEFSDFDDWMDRYQLLIDLGNEQEPLEATPYFGIPQSDFVPSYIFLQVVPAHFPSQ
jgi:hypothetical protein